jgi:hypothetical protein
MRAFGLIESQEENEISSVGPASGVASREGKQALICQ